MVGYNTGMTHPGWDVAITPGSCVAITPSTQKIVVREWLLYDQALANFSKISNAAKGHFYRNDFYITEHSKFGIFYVFMVLNFCFWSNFGISAKDFFADLHFVTPSTLGNEAGLSFITPITQKFDLFFCGFDPKSLCCYNRSLLYIVFKFRTRSATSKTMLSHMFKNLAPQAVGPIPSINS